MKAFRWMTLPFFAASLVASQSWAGVVGVDGQVTNLRVEGSYAFIGFAPAIPNCGDRVWLDMNSAIHRAMYATAMLAMTSGKPVTIRGRDDGQKVYGACPIYDIYLPR